MAESIPMHKQQHSTRLGGRAYAHHSQTDSDETEREYDRLRDLARAEAQKRNACFEKSQRAYHDGDGAEAKKLSNEGKQHAAKMEQYNKQASEYIFRANNATDRVADDTIDLHGQFVEEAEDILEARIRDAQARGQTHLHVIVGKGNHSSHHVQKIKPRVEQVCQELGLQYATEENEGRMYVNLQGGEVSEMPPMPSKHHGGDHHQGQHGGSHPRPAAPSQPQQPQQSQQSQQSQQQDNDEMEKLEKKIVSKILKKMDGCCIVM